MESLAYMVAFILGCVVVGGPLALGLTFVRTRRFKATITKAVAAIFLASISTLFSLILILNSGSFGSKILGFIGLATAIPAITRSVRSVRNFR